MPSSNSNNSIKSIPRSTLSKPKSPTSRHSAKSPISRNSSPSNLQLLPSMSSAAQTQAKPHKFSSISWAKSCQWRRNPKSNSESATTSWQVLSTNLLKSKQPPQPSSMNFWEDSELTFCSFWRASKSKTSILIKASWVWLTCFQEAKFHWTSTETTSQSSNQSVWLNCWTRTSTLSQWESRNGIHGIILNWPESSLTTIPLSDWPVWSETETPVKPPSKKSKKSAVMPISLKRSLKVAKTPWVKKSVSLIFNASVNSVRKPSRCSNSELKFKDIWRTEWKSSHQTLLNLSEKQLLPNLFLTQVHWAPWPSTQPQPSKFLVLRRPCSEPWNKRPKLPSMVFYTTPPSSVEPLERTKVKSPDSWPTSAPWLPDSTISSSTQPTDSDKSWKNKSKRDLPRLMMTKSLKRTKNWWTTSWLNWEKKIFTSIHRFNWRSLWRRRKKLKRSLLRRKKKNQSLNNQRKRKKLPRHDSYIILCQLHHSEFDFII